MKAFFLSMDALAAVSIMLLMMVLLSAQDFHPVAPGGVYLKDLSMDALSVMAQDGRLRSMADGNASAVRELMDALPSSVCMEVTLQEPGEEPLATVSRQGCWEFGKELQSLSAPFVRGDDLYLVTMRSWYRR
ncbi:MAG: hypothetical protein AB1295_06540 [Candidatus Micrarchaeota archaeon]